MINIRVKDKVGGGEVEEEAQGEDLGRRSVTEAVL